MTYSPAQAREATEKTWNWRLAEKHRPPIPLMWEEDGTAFDGTPLVCARIDSPYAANALLTFMREGSLSLDMSGPGQQPVLDENVPTRTALLWRTGGVWVELWHPSVRPAAEPIVQTAPDPEPVTAVKDATTAADAPAARLPFRRSRRRNPAA